LTTVKNARPPIAGNWWQKLFNFRVASIYVGIFCADVAKWFAIVYAKITERMIKSIERH
jgi:hypothetical protein